VIRCYQLVVLVSRNLGDTRAQGPSADLFVLKALSKHCEQVIAPGHSPAWRIAIICRTEGLEKLQRPFEREGRDLARAHDCVPNRSGDPLARILSADEVARYLALLYTGPATLGARADTPGSGQA